MNPESVTPELLQKAGERVSNFMKDAGKFLGINTRALVMMPA